MSPSLAAKALVAAVTIIVALGTACSASAESTAEVKLTFYGWPDNDPPNSAAIHYPGPPPRHGQAGGSGTYDNPTTVAVRKGSRWKPGTRMYLPHLAKYLIVEDSCASCTADWIDVWVGGRGSDSADVLACQHRLTPPGTVPVEIDPPDDRTVSAGGLC